MGRLDGKVAIITGGGGGIGRATALDFVANGVKQLTIVDVDETIGQETVQLVKDAGAEAFFVKTDVSDERQVEDYVKRTVDLYGRIDIFFNNAGIEGVVKPVIEYPTEMFEKVLQINVVGMFLGMKHVLPVMLKQQSGVIINTASVAGLMGAAGMTAYVASKHALIGLTRSVAAEVSSQGIRVNAICPSPIANRMMDSIEEQANPNDPSGVRQQYSAMIPAGRYGTSEEVAKTVTMLASDDAAWVMGVALPVDGGLTAT